MLLRIPGTKFGHNPDWFMSDGGNLIGAALIDKAKNVELT